MRFLSVAAALRHLHSPTGGSLTKLQHTQVTRAAKSKATCDGWAFTMENPSLVTPCGGCSITVAIAIASSSPSLTPHSIFFVPPCGVLVAA